MTYLALAWLGLLVLAANSGVGVPDGFGLAVFGLTLASIVYLYVCLCRRFPIMAWAGLGFLAGVFGQRPVYVYNEVTVDDEGNEVAVYDDCGAANDCSYDSSDDGGGSSGSRED